MSVLDVWTEQNRRLAIKLDVRAVMADLLIELMDEKKKPVEKKLEISSTKPRTFRYFAR